MAVAKLTTLTKSNTWTIENADVRLGIEKATGFLRSMVFKPSGVDLFAQTRGGIPGYVGGLRVYDECDDAWYDDLRTPFTVKDSRKRGNTVTVTRRYKGAPFVVTVAYSLDADGLRWQVQAVKANKKVADRSLRVYFMLPLIAGWNVWAPCKFGETAFDGMTPFEFMYTQIPYVSEQEIILPMVSHYSRQLNVGFSVVEPIDKNVPAAKFGFNNMDRCYNWGSMHKDLKTVPVLETVNYYIGMIGDRPMSTEVVVMFHEGDWRPGLGKVYRKWQPFFDPFNDAIYDREGCFLCWGVEAADEIDKLKAMGLKTLEVHGHFQDYSDYFQAGKDKWYRINIKEGVYQRMVKDRKEQAMGPSGANRAVTVSGDDVERFFAEHSDEQIAAYLGLDSVEKLCHRREDIARRLKALADAGISCHWYFNYTDGYRPAVEKNWPDAITRDEDGKPIPSGWYMCHNLCSDPSTSFGKFGYESARRIFEGYPTLDGFFLDCFRHYEIDFAHDDGTTVVNGKPAYSINHSYDDVERKIKTEIMQPRNLTSFANKPMSIRSMLYCDGQLLEGDGDMYEEKFFWASIANPLFYMWGGGAPQSVDEFLRRSVINGAYPTLVARTDENIALYQKYLPLFAQFRRRVLCFECDPMRVPKGSRGKLYTVADGYVAGIMNEHIDAGDQVAWAKAPYALFRVARGHDVTKVGVMYPGEAELREAKFKFDGTFIAVPLTEYVNCAVVKLFVTGDSGKAIGTDLFWQRDRMCGNPESSFEDISWR